MRKTRFTGVYENPSTNRKYEGRPDVCFYITFKDNGKKVFEKVGWRSEGYTAAYASDVRSERVRDIRHGKASPQGRKGELTINDAWALYLEKWLHGKPSEQSDEALYRLWLAPAFGMKKMAGVRPVDIEEFKNRMLAQRSPQTVKHALGLLRRVYRKMAAWGEYKGDIPTVSVPMPKVDNGRLRFLTPDEAVRLVEALRKRSVLWADVSLVSLHAGLRLDEILGLQACHVDIDNRLLHVMDAKCGTRTVPLADSGLCEMLRQRKAACSGAEDFVFKNRNGERINNISQTVVRVIHDLGFNHGITDRRHKVVFHTLRHTFGSWMAQRGVPLYVIGELMGHSTLEMTRRYSKLCPETKVDALSFITQAMNSGKSE
jgi:integrase